MPFRILTGIVAVLLPTAAAYGQGGAVSPQGPPGALPSRLSTAQKWQNFVSETVSLLTLGAGIFNGGLSHLTNSDPRYGTNSEAFAQRFGASVADVTTQNFFGDFVLASAFHEDPRYFRKGPQHSIRSRAAYAISRAVIIRRDEGGNSFNWSNVVGTAMSAGLSNAYYPPPSRTGGAMIIHFVTSVAGAGFSNLAPEFWPDFKKVFKRHS